MEKQVDYRSLEFYKIIDEINKFLALNNLGPISPSEKFIFDSKYTVGTYGNTKIWRITDYNYSYLLNETLMTNLKSALFTTFSNYINKKIITLGNPKYTKTSTGKPMASIVISLTELPDNIITAADAIKFELGEDQDVIEKCLEIESRMFRRSGDVRDPRSRIKDFIFSLEYEPQLVSMKLNNIENLKLKHQTDVITLETDKNTDFSGVINNQLFNIEGKSTKDTYVYKDTAEGQIEFAEYFKNRLDSGSIGSIHNADYVLFIIKLTNQIVCINMHNLNDNWLAGKLDKNIV